MNDSIYLLVDWQVIMVDFVLHTAVSAQPPTTVNLEGPESAWATNEVTFETSSSTYSRCWLSMSVGESRVQ